MDESDEFEEADPNWFRAPTQRERRIAAALFVGFGLFFAALFIVLSGWWFRWVMLVLGIYSIISAVRYLRSENTNAKDAKAPRRQEIQ